MYTVTKSKGRVFKTNDLHTAIRAYTGNKRSLTLWQDNNIVMTRIEFMRLGNQPVWIYLQKRGVK